jgi:PAS domain S-box-containing protein
VAVRLLLPGVALAVVLLAVFFAQRDATSTLSQNVRAQAQAEQEVSLGYHTETLVLDMETGVRGFLLTHERQFLQPLLSARAEFPPSAAALVALAARNGDGELALARRIQTGGEAFMRDFAVPEIRAVEANSQTAVSVASVLRGKQQVDALRAVFTELIERGQQPAAPAERRAQSAASRASACVLVGLVAALALLAVSAVYLRRGVLRPIRRVAKVADAMAAGDLSVRVEPASATELTRLANSFNTMADGLQEGHNRLEAQAAELRGSEAFLDSVLEHIPNMLVVKAASDLRFVRFNRAGEQLLGYSREQLLGKNDYDLFAADQADTFTAQDRQTLASGAPLDIAEEPMHSLQNGLRYLHTKKIPVLDEYGSPRYLLAISEDITERKRADQVVRDAKEEAERANRAKSEFLSRMSHEFRTPLNSILGFGQLLKMDGLSESQREPIHYILESGRHLLLLINDLLDIARIEAGGMTISLEPVAIGSLLRDVVAMVAPIAAKCTVGLEIVPLDSEWYVLADQQRTKQVLLNLLSNAIKYNREGGEVKIVCERAGRNLRVLVRDTGLGIPTERLAEAFTPFDRLGAERDDIEGAGLGLALSRQLMELMGGTLTVDSEAGVGCTFTAELALAATTDRSSYGSDELETLGDDQRDGASAARLLYVEDNMANIKLVERVLGRRPGITVVATGQGQLGLELARHHPPDVIVLDLHLPDLPGEAVLNLLKRDARTALIPVIVLTADASPGHARSLRELGAAAYVTKPLDVPSFLATLDEVLLAGTPVPG